MCLLYEKTIKFDLYVCLDYLYLQIRIECDTFIYVCQILSFTIMVSIIMLFYLGDMFTKHYEQNQMC